jgi:hypothetical protein
MRRRFWVMVAAMLVWVNAAHAGALVEWVSPHPGAVWRAGEPVTLEWRRTEPWPLGLDVEEWEAFLSLDGGRSFPVRLTPHLEADLRAVRVRVPALPTGHAALLLRFGNEKREIEWLVPGEFQITAGGSGAERQVSTLAFQRFSAERGESARAGDAGVVVWAEGRRDGGDWRAASAAPRSAFAPAVETLRDHDESSSASETSSRDADERPAAWLVPAADSRRAPRASPRTRRDIPILRLIERQNE